MKRAAALVTALVSATACSVALSACSHGGDASTMTGRLSSTIPAFCIGDPSGTGQCFVTSESSGVKESELAAGDCVRVTYQPPAAGQPAAKATKVERATC